MMNSDDDDCALPADTQLILQQFLRERELQESNERTSGAVAFEENWQLSQFWYDTATKETLAGVVQRIREELSNETELRVALLSAPSLYQHVVNVNPNVTLFEFDTRFNAYGTNFQHYDYSRATEPDYLDEYRGAFDLIIADPPFLSEECIEKIGLIMKKLADGDKGKIILCSGATVREWAHQFIGLHLCKFMPQHERNLGNEFCSYANFDLDAMLPNNKLPHDTGR